MKQLRDNKGRYSKGSTMIYVIGFAVILFIGVAFMIPTSDATDYVAPVEIGTISDSEYEERVSTKIDSEVAKKMVRNWAEREVSEEIIIEQEVRLEELRAEELSF